MLDGVPPKLKNANKNIAALLTEGVAAETSPSKRSKQPASQPPDEPLPPTFELKLKALLVEIFQECQSIQDRFKLPHYSASKLFRAWSLTCHPDKPYHDFSFQGTLILSQALIAQINDKLCTHTAESCNSHKGHFFGVLKTAYETFPHEKGFEKENHVNPWAAFEGTVNTTNIWQTIEDELHSQNLLSDPINEIRLADKSLVLMKFSENNYFVGSLKEWLLLEFSKRISEVLHQTPNQDAAIYHLEKSFQQSSLYLLLKDINPSTLFSKALSEIYSQSTKALCAPSHPQVMPGNEAMIKYQLLLLHKEFNRPDYQQSNLAHKIKIHPLGFGAEVVYETTNLQEYFHFITSLALLQILLVEPAYFSNNAESFMLLKHHLKPKKKKPSNSNFATSFTDKQYELLCDLFSKNPSAEILAKINIPRELLNSINAKLAAQKHINWLLEHSHWLYAHGVEGTSPPTELWQAFKKTLMPNNAQAENPANSNEQKHGNILGEINKLPQREKLKRLPGFLDSGLFQLPWIFWNALIFYYFSGFKLFALMMTFNAECLIGNPKEGLLPPLFYFQAESLLHRLALLNACEKIPHPNPKWSVALDNFYRQVIPLLKRILWNPLDTYHSKSTRFFLHLAFPLRALLGLSLATLCLASFAMKGLIQKLVKLTALIVFSCANYCYDGFIFMRDIPQAYKKALPAIFQSLMQLFKRQEKKSLSPAPNTTPEPLSMVPEIKKTPTFTVGYSQNQTTKSLKKHSPTAPQEKIHIKLK